MLLYDKMNHFSLVFESHFELHIMRLLDVHQLDFAFITNFPWWNTLKQKMLQTFFLFDRIVLKWRMKGWMKLLCNLIFLPTCLQNRYHYFSINVFALRVIFRCWFFFRSFVLNNLLPETHHGEHWSVMFRYQTSKWVEKAWHFIHLHRTLKFNHG